VTYNKLAVELARNGA